MTETAFNPKPATMREQLLAIMEMLNRIVPAIEGNGKKGLIERASILEAEVATIKAQHAEEKERAKEEERRRKKNIDAIVIGVIMMVISNIGVIVTMITRAAEGAK